MAHSTTQADQSVAYKILTAAELETLESDRTFTGAPVDLADGFIHMSTAGQVRETLDKHFAGQSDLAIAMVNLSAFGDAVKWEPSRGGALFPHLYGSLPLSAVVAYGAVRYDENGELILPVAG